VFLPQPIDHGLQYRTLLIRLVAFAFRQPSLRLLHPELLLGNDQSLT
jgi:hypothetical protein